MDLSKILSKERQSYRNIIVALSALFLVFLCFYLFNRIENKIVISIDGFEVNKASLTVGDNSDITIKSVPHDFMKVTYNDDEHGFEWMIDRSRDSLCYFLINGENPNRYKIISTTKVKLSGFDGNDSVIECDGNEIVKYVNQYSDTQYFLLRNVLSVMGDSSRQVLKEHKNIKSLIFKKDNEVSIIILDPYTSIDGMQYAYHGSTRDLTPDRKDLCKVQFFAVKDLFIKYEQVDKNMFHIGKLNYIVKPVLQTTEWGAGHILISPAGNNLMRVRYPKGVMYVEDLGVLQNMANSHSGLITLKQQSHLQPLSDNIYLPQFSSALNFDICNLVFTDEKPYLLSNCNDSIAVGSTLHLVPSFDRKDLFLGPNKIDIRYGILDWNFILSIIAFPFLMLGLILVTHCFLMRKERIKQIRKASNQAMRYPSYFVSIALIAFVFCIGKIMIALKLSYTYPYFEKLTGIISISTGLILLLFCLTSLLLNFDFITDTDSKKRNFIDRLRLYSPCIMGLVGLIISLLILSLLDGGVNWGAKSSYFTEEWFTFRVDNWRKLAGINDTHRSVVYTLFLACGFISILLFFLALSKKIRSISWLDVVDKYTTLRLKWRLPVGFTNRIMNLFPRTIANCIMKILSGTMLVVIYLINNLFVVAVLLLAANLPFFGNFATAYITLISIWGLSRSLNNIEPTEGAVVNMLEMLLSSVIVMIFAFLPDHGYITNYFGFIAAVLMFYMLIQKSNLSVALSKEERNRKEWELKWFPRIGLIVSIFLFVVPFIYNKYSDSEKVDYNRSSRRFMLASKFEQYHESGYRYADSDVEFMKILYHYMGNNKGDDPLSNEKHQLHPSISTGQSPVILNDVSLPSSFLGAYGNGAYFVYFALILLLFYVVTTYTLTGCADNVTVPFDRYSQWRLLAMLMWIGTTMYLYLSYCGVLPFTGRLNPGYGVDAVGEALESAFLLAIMTATSTRSN